MSTDPWADYRRGNLRARLAYIDLTTCIRCGATPIDPLAGSRKTRCLTCRYEKEGAK